MKKLFLVAVTLAVCTLCLTSSADAQFKNRGVYLGPNITLATTPVGFGADIEFAISPNIGLGGMVRYWGQSESWYGGSWSWSVIIPQFIGFHHFLPNNQLDPYIGARLGYGIYSYSSDLSGFSGYGKSDLYLSGAGGLRYFLNPNLSLHGSVEFHLAGSKYVGGTGIVAGVDFTL